MRIRALARCAAPLVALTLLAAACGDDDDAAAPSRDDDTKELCDLAKEINEQEDLPSAAQISKYTRLAPDELDDAVKVAGPPIIEADGDPVKFFRGIADDDVEEAVAEIDAYEAENCDVEHEPPVPDEITTLDPSAKQVAVTASEYTFDFTKELPAGRTSFVLTNSGQEAHFLFLSKILPGHTLEEVLAYEGDPTEAGMVEDQEFSSKVAAPGGDDEEVFTTDLTPGSWAMLCFVGGPDGTPHAFMGMAVPFTVT